MPTILITGASRGIGRKLAELYVADGWQVLAASRAGPAVWGTQSLTMDVAERASIEAAAGELDGQPIDVLVNNAGIYGGRGVTLGSIDDAEWRLVQEVNVLGPARVAEAFMPNLLAGGQKKLVTISSRMGSLASGGSGELAYRASKAAVNAVMRAIAMEQARQGLIVTLMSPGWVRTDMGGPSAAISVDESASGIKQVIDGLDGSSNGAFLNYDGSAIPW